MNKVLPRRKTTREAGGPGKVHSIGKLRSMVREMLAEELGQIDELVEPMLRTGGQ